MPLLRAPSSREAHAQKSVGLSACAVPGDASWRRVRGYPRPPFCPVRPPFRPPCPEPGVCIPEHFIHARLTAPLPQISPSVLGVAGIPSGNLPLSLTIKRLSFARVPPDQLALVIFPGRPLTGAIILAARTQWHVPTLQGSHHAPRDGAQGLGTWRLCWWAQTSCFPLGKPARRGRLVGMFARGTPLLAQRPGLFAQGALQPLRSLISSRSPTGVSRGAELPCGCACGAALESDLVSK